MSQEYIIESFQDIMKIPPEKIDKFMAEFQEALLIAYHTTKLAEEIGEAIVLDDRVSKETVCLMKRFTWKDDDENKLTINLETVKS